MSPRGPRMGCDAAPDDRVARGRSPQRYANHMHRTLIAPIAPTEKEFSDDRKS